MLHVPDLAYSGNGSKDSASPKVELGEFFEDGLRLDELDEQLDESDEDCHKLDELQNNSASPMKIAWSSPSSSSNSASHMNIHRSRGV